MIRPAVRPFTVAALLASVTLAACGAPRPSDPGPVAGAELTEPDFGAEAPPELLGAPDEVALPETFVSPPGAVPEPPAVGNYVLTVPDPNAPVGPGGPVDPQPFGIAAAQPRQPIAPEPPRAYADASPRPAAPRVYRRLTPPAEPPALLGGPTPPPARPELAPREYASADVIGRPALPRAYGARLAPRLTDVAPTPRSGPPPVVVAMAPIPDDVRVPTAPARPAAPPRPEPAPMVMAMAPVPNDTRFDAGGGRGYPQARANAPEAVTGPSGNAPAFDPAQQTDALARADARAPAASGVAPTSPPPVLNAAAPAAPAQTAAAAAAAAPLPQARVDRDTRAATPATPAARTADAAPRPRTPASTPERAEAKDSATTAVTAARAPVTNGGPERSTGGRVPAGVWWALCLLAAGLIAVVLLVSRPDRSKPASS